MCLGASDVKSLAYELGANLCGIASVDRFFESPPGYHPCDVLSECNSVIVVASAFPECSLNQGSDIYTMARDLMADKMDLLAVELASSLLRKGVSAVSVRSMGNTKQDAQGRYRGPISLKHAAWLAGLGQFGKNTLLINEVFGNMLWMSAVLVDAKLEADPLATYEVCPADCHACEIACPANAIEHGSLFNQLACFGHAYGYPGGKETINCHLCRSICPNHEGLRR